MRIKLDENLPHDLSPALAELGHDVRTVVEQGLTGRADRVASRELMFRDLTPSS